MNRAISCKSMKSEYGLLIFTREGDDKEYLHPNLDGVSCAEDAIAWMSRHTTWGGSISTFGMSEECGGRSQICATYADSKGCTDTFAMEIRESSWEDAAFFLMVHLAMSDDLEFNSSAFDSLSSRNN